MILKVQIISTTGRSYLIYHRKDGAVLPFAKTTPWRLLGKVHPDTQSLEIRALAESGKRTFVRVVT